MTSNTWPYLEDIFPESLSEIYTLENINRMIYDFEELYNVNFSNEIFDLLQGNDEWYIRTALEIKEAIKIYENESWLEYDFNSSPIDNNIEEQELMDQMKKINSKSSNIVSINGWEYKTETVKARSWVKKIVDKLLYKLKKIS